MDEPEDTQELHKRWTGGELLLCVVIQLVLVNVAYRIDRRQQAPLLSTSAWSIFFGLLCGAALACFSQSRAHDAGLDPEILFFGLLPPIILEAGFNTQRKGFFSNFAAILMLAVGGTLIATFVTGGLLLVLGAAGLIPLLTAAEAFLYGSLVSAIDPVATLLVFKKCNAPSMLFNLVFGESVLNDAVAIVLFTLFQRLVESGGTEVNTETAVFMTLQLIGIMAGSIALSGVVCYSSAYLLRHSEASLRDHPTYEISIILLSAYGSYLAADFFELSGILAVFFSGVFIRHYHMYNISKASAFAFTHLLSTISFLAENFIYLYLGISLIAYRQSFLWNWPFVLASSGACLAARAFNTFPLCAVANLCRSPRRKIPLKHQFVIWFSGLRGAIAFALALNVKTSDPSHAAIIKSSTLLIVLFTTVFFGMGTGPLLQALDLAGGSEASAKSSQRTHSVTSESGQRSNYDLERQPLLTDSQASPPGSRSVHVSWVRIDEKYLKPVFGGRPRGMSDSSVSHWHPEQQ